MCKLRKAIKLNKLNTLYAIGLNREKWKLTHKHVPSPLRPGKQLRKLNNPLIHWHFLFPFQYVDTDNMLDFAKKLNNKAVNKIYNKTKTYYTTALPNSSPLARWASSSPTNLDQYGCAFHTFPISSIGIPLVSGSIK